MLLVPSKIELVGLVLLATFGTLLEARTNYNSCRGCGRIQKKFGGEDAVLRHKKEKRSLNHDDLLSLHSRGVVVERRKRQLSNRKGEEEESLIEANGRRRRIIGEEKEAQYRAGEKGEEVELAENEKDWRRKRRIRKKREQPPPLKDDHHQEGHQMEKEAFEDDKLRLRMNFQIRLKKREKGESNLETNGGGKNLGNPVENKLLRNREEKRTTTTTKKKGGNEMKFAPPGGISEVGDLYSASEDSKEHLLGREERGGKGGSNEVKGGGGGGEDEDGGRSSLEGGGTKSDLNEEKDKERKGSTTSSRPPQRPRQRLGSPLKGGDLDSKEEEGSYEYRDEDENTGGGGGDIMVNNDQSEEEEDDGTMEEKKEKVPSVTRPMSREVPWQHFIVHKASAHFCPSVSVNRKFMLTSQSCIRAFENRSVDLSDLLVYPAFPSDRIRELVRDGPSVPRVLGVTHHPDFALLVDGGTVGDLSVVQVIGQDLDEGALAPVCLPSVSKIKKSMKSGHYVHFFWPRNLTSIYQKPFVEVARVADRGKAKCKEFIKDKKASEKDHRVCVTTVMKSSTANCVRAYTGGAITQYNEITERHSVVGIFSSGDPECGEGHAGVFTRVDRYLKWIVKRTQEGECGEEEEEEQGRRNKKKHKHF